MSLIPAIKEVMEEHEVSDPMVENVTPVIPISKILNSEGATVRAACKKLVSIMEYGGSENLQLLATKEILDLHGVKEEENRDNVPTLIIMGDVKKVNAIYTPRKINDADIIIPIQEEVEMLQD